jgi:hypothetical protein
MGFEVVIDRLRLAGITEKRNRAPLEAPWWRSVRSGKETHPIEVKAGV